MGGVLVRANETSCWQAKSRPLTKNTKSKICLVCNNGFSLNFLTNHKQDHKLENAIRCDSLVWPTSEKIKSVIYECTTLMGKTVCLQHVQVMNCQWNRINAFSLKMFSIQASEITNGEPKVHYIVALKVEIALAHWFVDLIQLVALVRQDSQDLIADKVGTDFLISWCISRTDELWWNTCNALRCWCV